MTKEEAVKEIEKAFEPAFANYIITALTEGATVSDKEPNTWRLDDAREDFMHDVYNTLDFLPTNDEANCIIDIFDRVTSSIKQEPRKGHWIEHEESISTASKHLRECSCCKCYFDWLMPRNSFCPNCGADMREVKE